MGWLIRFLVSGIALFITQQVLDKAFPHDLSHMQLSPDLGRAALAVIGLMVINSLVRPIVNVLAIPVRMVTFGLASLVINSIFFWAVGYYTRGYDVGGIVGLALGPILMGLISGVLGFFVKD